MAGIAGALAAIVGWELLAGLERVTLLRATAALIAPARAAGSDGREAKAAERRRLALLAAVIAALIGWSLLGAAPALLVAGFGPFAALLVIRARQKRWRARVNRDASPAARAIADSLSSGRSLSVAIDNAAREGALCAATRAALHEVTASIAIGLSPDDALETLRRRCGEGPWETIIAAVQLQRSTGGDLTRLLRELAGELDGISRALREARAASAQARLTARIVLVMPLIGAMIFALAAPGALAAIFSSAVPRALLFVAASLQAVAILAVRRVARVRR
ncbi:unannotated protein [freshwater metagenome]|uniref:Unannotated protein n=1 Tax=freshwater metagenome TaxID=449393 RepID=A0A6J6A3M6_9ZZZZ